MNGVPKSIRAAGVLTLTGLTLTLLIQLHFSPVLLTLFFLVALPCCAAGVGLYVFAVYRDAIKPKL